MRGPGAVSVERVNLRWLPLALAACGGGGSATPGEDGGIDVLVDAGHCFGAGLVRTCLAALPDSALALENTLDTTTDSRCIDDQGMCVLAGTDIQIGTLRITGAKPAVFVATGAITLQSLDASSKRLGERGPAANSTACIPPQTPSQNGGGPGGTFGGRGGNGGVGGLNGAESGLVVSVTAFRGGCAGARGDGTTGGDGGASGGAVYLIARARIDVQSINASGAAGLGGMSGGGGGGGSGGLIGLEAPTVAVTGAVFANGGGGGEGGANGANGADPAAATSPALGGNGGAGGDGGAGSAGTTKTGAKGSDAVAGGGGGGGGAGVIILIPTQTTGGVLSPAPT